LKNHLIINFYATLIAEIGHDQWSYWSQKLIHRQHHPGGTDNMIFMAKIHFKMPNNFQRTNSSNFLDAMIYFSQMNQAISYQTQSEHYRR
jgi:beta-mannosidase